MKHDAGRNKIYLTETEESIFEQGVLKNETQLQGDLRTIQCLIESLRRRAQKCKDNKDNVELKTAYNRAATELEFLAAIIRG